MSGVTFSNPMALWWLAGLIPLWWMHRRGLVDFPARQRGLSLAVRMLMVVLLALALSGLGLNRTSDRQFTVFLMDRSASVDEAAERAMKSFVAEAWEGHRSGDIGRVIQFAAESTPPRGVVDFLHAETNTLPLVWHDRATDVEGALAQALAQMDPECGRRIVLCTDGHATGRDPEGMLKRVREAGAVVDVWPVPPRQAAEVQVTQVRAPTQVHAGEPFEARVNIHSSEETPATIRVYVNGIQVGGQQVELRPGDNRFTLPSVTAEQNLMKVRVEVDAEADHLADNNSGAALVRAEGKPSVLVIESQPQDARYLRRALQEEGIEVEVRSERGMPRTLSELRSVDLLCLSDVPATALTTDQMELIRSYVRDFGGGFMMLGGDSSFGLGGYYKTPVEEILPVRTDFERERENPSLAMILVIDKSGSMGGQKIELAKEASKATVELLGARDQIAVLAFDGQSHWVCEMHSAGDRGYVVDRISGLQAGGGTDLAPALSSTYAAMERVSAKLKHVIVLSDGHSAPGNFFELVSAMRTSGITVSTVGVGQGADRQLLEQVAMWGSGRYYFTTDPLAIPQIFAKETITASRSAIQELPFQAVPVMPHPVTRGVDWGNAPFLLGYVMTRPKPTGEVLLATERGDPLLSVWRFGLGNVAAFTSDAKARWAAEWIEWDGFGRFWVQVVRETLRVAEPGRMRVKLESVEGRIRVVGEVEAKVEEGEIRLAAVLPGGRELDAVMVESAPGLFERWIEDVEEGEVHVQVGRWVAGRMVESSSAAMVQGYPEEFQLKPPATERMESWAEAGGGRYDPPSASVLGEDRQEGTRSIRLWPWLMASVLVLLPVDIALRRLVLM